MDCGTHGRQENSPSWEQHNYKCRNGMLEKVYEKGRSGPAIFSGFTAVGTGSGVRGEGIGKILKYFSSFAKLLPQDMRSDILPPDPSQSSVEVRGARAAHAYSQLDCGKATLEQ
ncbi:hypothetical protein NDU88_002070 [Pleurodeles waltl]|uniref:Uncharacterized protein n=1 Tax=Pleurodeles waltl TaxID=8319 RepID=A0AAV7T1D7_PLEWA|nr:hypothetical protein NDU88_002070 [Pleurodeles waltl]